MINDIACELEVRKNEICGWWKRKKLESIHVVFTWNGRKMTDTSCNGFLLFSWNLKGAWNDEAKKRNRKEGKQVKKYNELSFRLQSTKIQRENRWNKIHSKLKQAKFMIFFFFVRFSDSLSVHSLSLSPSLCFSLLFPKLKPNGRRGKKLNKTSERSNL